MPSPVNLRTLNHQEETFLPLKQLFQNMAGELQVLIAPLGGRRQVPAFQECNHILFSFHLSSVIRPVNIDISLFTHFSTHLPRIFARTPFPLSYEHVPRNRNGQ